MNGGKKARGGCQGPFVWLGAKERLDWTANELIGTGRRAEMGLSTVIVRIQSYYWFRTVCFLSLSFASLSLHVEFATR